MNKILRSKTHGIIISIVVGIVIIAGVEEFHDFYQVQKLSVIWRSLYRYTHS